MDNCSIPQPNSSQFTGTVTVITKQGQLHKKLTDWEDRVNCSCWMTDLAGKQKALDLVNVNVNTVTLALGERSWHLQLDTSNCDRAPHVNLQDTLLEASTLKPV